MRIEFCIKFKGVNKMLNRYIKICIYERKERGRDDCVVLDS